MQRQVAECPFCLGNGKVIYGPDTEMGRIEALCPLCRGVGHLNPVWIGPVVRTSGIFKEPKDASL
jgi:hypothetical protein